MMFGDTKDMVRKYDWALILYDRPDAAEEAIKEMNNVYIDDQQVSVRMASKQKEEYKPLIPMKRRRSPSPSPESDSDQ